MAYTIASGDTLTALAKKWGVSVQDIMAANPQITDPNKIYAGANLNMPGQTGSATPTSQNVYSQLEELQQQSQSLQTQLKTKQDQLGALQKYGLEDTNQLTQDAQGNWVPRGEQEGDEWGAWEEAKTALDPQRATELSELEADAERERGRLTQDWQSYLDDLNTGKIRAGTDYQKQAERALQERSQQLQQQEFSISRNMENLNRQWMGRGGLFSGARLQAGQHYMTQEQMAKERYTTGWDYGQQQQKTAYERSMEDYGRAEQKGLTAYQRGTEDIGLQKVKDVRSLNEYYNQQLSKYAGATNLASARKFMWGY